MLRKTENWKEISRKVVFKKYGRGIDKVVFELPDGQREDYYIKAEDPVVAVVALTEDNKVIMVEQFRPGPQEVLLELPGGGINDSENAEEAMTRELLEETGYQGKMRLVKRIIDDGYSARQKHCLVATNCKKVAEQKLDRTEFLRVELISLEEFRNLLRSGKNTDIEIGYLALDYLELL